MLQVYPRHLMLHVSTMCVLLCRLRQKALIICKVLNRYGVWRHSQKILTKCDDGFLYQISKEIRSGTLTKRNAHKYSQEFKKMKVIGKESFATKLMTTTWELVFWKFKNNQRNRLYRKRGLPLECVGRREHWLSNWEHDWNTWWVLVCSMCTVTPWSTSHNISKKPPKHEGDRQIRRTKKGCKLRKAVLKSLFSFSMQTGILI